MHFFTSLAMSPARCRMATRVSGQPVLANNLLKTLHNAATQQPPCPADGNHNSERGKQYGSIDGGSSGGESYTNRHCYAPRCHWSPLTNMTTMGYEPTEHRSRSRCRLRTVAFFATHCQV